MSLLVTEMKDPADSFLISFYYKAIDIFDGIIQLHKYNLDECSQVLLRVLFETYLKYMHFNKLTKTKGIKEAITIVLESMIIMREKDAIRQDVALGTHSENYLSDITEEIKIKYTAEELKSVKKHGFPRLTVEQLAKEHKKTREYEVMYRNFSRNVHANDTHEYMLKQGVILEDSNNSNDDYTESKNDMAFNIAFELFFQMMEDMNNAFSLKIDNELREIFDKYKQISQL